MAPPPTGFQGFRVTYAGGGGVTQDAMVTGGLHLGTFNQASVDDAAGIIGTALRGSLSSDADIVDFEAFDDVLVALHSTEANGAGAHDSGQISPNVALLVRKNTAFAGRSARGRWYLPFINESDVDGNGAIGSSFRGGVTGLMTTMLSDLDGGPGPLVLLHADGSTPFNVLSMAAQPLAATQRRRLRP